MGIANTAAYTAKPALAIAVLYTIANQKCTGDPLCTLAVADVFVPFTLIFTLESW